MIEASIEASLFNLLSVEWCSLVGWWLVESDSYSVSALFLPLSWVGSSSESVLSPSFHCRLYWSSSGSLLSR